MTLIKLQSYYIITILASLNLACCFRVQTGIALRLQFIAKFTDQNNLSNKMFNT